MPDRIRPAPGVEGAGIGDEGMCSTLLYLIDHLPGKDRVYVGVAPPLPDMQFDGRKVVRPDDLVEPGGLKEAADLLGSTLMVAPCPEIGEIDVCHRRLHPSQVLSDQQGIRVVPAGQSPERLIPPV